MNSLRGVSHSRVQSQQELSGSTVWQPELARSVNSQFMSAILGGGKNYFWFQALNCFLQTIFPRKYTYILTRRGLTDSQTWVHGTGSQLSYVFARA
jgi:hypothetical protein